MSASDRMEKDLKTKDVSLEVHQGNIVKPCLEIKNTEVDKKEEEDLQRESELRVESVASQVEPLKEENQKEGGQMNDNKSGKWYTVRS